MFRALSFTRKITGLATPSAFLPSYQPYASSQLAQNRMPFGFCESKGGLPRNK